MTIQEKMSKALEECAKYTFKGRGCVDCPVNKAMGCVAIAEASEVELDQMLKLFHDANPTIASDKDEMNDNVNHPSHYTHGMESIEEMREVFGVEAVKSFCLCNVWKYRKRALYKNGEEDMAKADWYMAKYMELKNEPIPFD